MTLTLSIMLIVTFVALVVTTHRAQVLRKAMREAKTAEERAMKAAHDSAVEHGKVIALYPERHREYQAAHGG